MQQLIILLVSGIRRSSTSYPVSVCYFVREINYCFASRNKFGGLLTSTLHVQVYFSFYWILAIYIYYYKVFAIQDSIRYYNWWYCVCVKRMTFTGVFLFFLFLYIWFNTRTCDDTYLEIGQKRVKSLKTR